MVGFSCKRYYLPGEYFSSIPQRDRLLAGVLKIIHLSSDIYYFGSCTFLDSPRKSNHSIDFLDEGEIFVIRVSVLCTGEVVTVYMKEIC